MQFVVQHETASAVTVKLSSKSEGVDRQTDRDRQTAWYRPHVTPVPCCITIFLLFFYPFLSPPYQCACPLLSCHSPLLLTTNLSLILFHHFHHHYCLPYTWRSPNACVFSRAVPASRIHVTCFTPAQPGMCTLPDNRIASLR